MRRIFLFSIAALLALAAIAVGVGAWLIQDEAFLKNQASSLAYRFTGRKLRIDGPLELSVGRTLVLNARGIHFANASWAQPPDMVTVGRLHVAVTTRSLWRSKVEILAVELSDCAVNLVQSAEHGSNWADLLPEETAESPEEKALPITLRRALVQDCRLLFEQPDQVLDVEASHLAIELDENRNWQAEGAAAINGEALELAGWYGPVGALMDGGRLDHDLVVTLGEVSLESHGYVTDVHAGTGANINTRFRGPAIEKLLERLGQFAFTEGPFDFRLDLSTEGAMTDLSVVGDIGDLKINSSGRLDSLVNPQSGQVKTRASGSNLQRLGPVLGLPWLVDEAFDLRLDAHFEPGLVNLDAMAVRTAGDELRLDGVVGTTAGMAGTELHVELSSREIGRWSPLLGRTPRSIGPVELIADLLADPSGLLGIKANMVHGVNDLEVDGTLGRLADGIQPDVRLRFHTTNIGPLATLAGLADFPAIPIMLEGRLAQSGPALQLENLVLEVDGDRAEINGRLALENRLAGSDVTVKLDIADLARLGNRFGRDGLPAQPLRITADLKPEGEGVRFKLYDAASADIRLDVEGHIPDLADATALDARFDVALPDVSMLQFLAGNLNLPAIPASVRGSLENQPSETLLQDVQIMLGRVEAAVEGRLLPQKAFDLRVNVQAPDVSQLEPLMGSMPAVPANLKAHLHGNTSAFRLDEVDLQLGDSDLSGEVALDLSGPPDIEGRFVSSYLDLRHWEKEEAPEAPAEAKPSSGRRFSDEPLPSLADLGFALRLRLEAERLQMRVPMLTDLQIVVTLNPQLLHVEPFRFTPPRGSRVEGHFLFDQSGSIPVMDASLFGTGIQIGLGTKEGQPLETVPKTDIDVVMRGVGNTPHEMAASLNGKIRLVSGEGQVATATVSILFTDFLTELYNTLNPFAEDSDYTTLQCTVAAIDVRDGRALIGPVVINTTELTIFSEGKVNLDSEKLDINFNTKPKKGLGLSAGVIIHPLTKVGGTLSSPLIMLDPKGTVISGTAAVATAGLSLLAKSMSDRFLSSKDPCGDALTEIRKRETAAPDG